MPKIFKKHVIVSLKKTIVEKFHYRLQSKWANTSPTPCKCLATSFIDHMI